MSTKSPAKAAAEHAAELNAAQHTTNLEATVEHLRAELLQKNGLLKKYQAGKGRELELARQATEAIRALMPLPLVPFKPKSATREISAVMNLSDIHAGEVIRPAETGGFGAFNFAIAEQRLDTYFANELSWIEMHRRAYNIQDLHIFGIGDYISGSIHFELLVTNEATSMVCAVKCGDWLANRIGRIAPHFRRVYFHGIGADNHGRLQPKPQAKGKAENNYSYIVHAMIERQLSAHKNVVVKLYEDMKPVVDVGGQKFLVFHGDTIKCVLGIPYYGLERDRGREATRRMGTERNFDYVNIGHFHVPSLIAGNMIVNGSLSGTSEFDSSCGRHAPPSQVTYLVHPKYGIFDMTAWKFSVSDEETDARRK